MESLRRSPYDGDRLDGSEKAKQLANLYRKLGYRYAMCRLDNYVVYDKRQQVVLNALTQFANSMKTSFDVGRGGLLLFGKPGTGKDHLVSALLQIATLKGYTAEWWDGLALAMEARSRMNSDATTESQLIRDLVKPQILAISDPIPPKGELSQYQLSTLRLAIDSRYRKGKVTWITTNLDERQRAEELLTAPLMDRLREGALQLFCEWDSYREGMGK